jgi:hypothetical protein
MLAAAQLSGSRRMVQHGGAPASSSQCSFSGRTVRVAPVQMGGSRPGSRRLVVEAVSWVVGTRSSCSVWSLAPALLARCGPPAAFVVQD